MKKLVTLLSVPVVLLVAWGGTNWYMGQQTETSLKHFIEQQNQASAQSGIKQELVSYEKSAFGAKAITKLIIDVPPLSGLGEIQFINDITNGPVFMGGTSPVQFGTARVHTQLDMESLEAEQRQWLTTAFDGKPPLEGNTVIGFGGSTDYDFLINPLKVDQDGTTVLLESMTLSGTSAADMTGNIKLQAGKIEIKDATAQFTLPSLQMDGDVTGMIGGQALGTFDLNMPGISILAEDTTVPVSFDLAVQSDSGVADNALSGKVALQATNIQGADDALSKLDFMTDVSGLDVAGVQELGKLQAELQSVQNQMLWSAESMETPEGQQKQQALMTQLTDTTGKIVETLFGKVLKTDKSRVHSTLLAESAKGKLNADIDLTYTGKEIPDLMALAGYGPNEWAKMLKGKMTLDADKAMLPPGTEMLLTPLSEQGLLKLEGEKIMSAVELAGENVTLNGQQMPFADFINKLAPAGMESGMPEEGGDPNMGIPDDLMQKIEAEGLTPEIMQLLEESDDVPKETIEIMKQLQQMQQQLGVEGLPETEPAPKADDKKE
ncbi:Uncharacterized conserved protein YdgA, DUF945 family [Thiothrix caldifontis]|uniref:Uncharacterized conserved protein YdgA, DUF945 family n=1 Tax=Thiothrix caldifontis TaxID=525918 RepID=A0A1H4AAK9_9GAMM|nr:DUF945 family protein [Thiothrix caldifontis]SEA32808.1 Uncharacterized conserved protein YdgA, DUF945 family [Thiothrix caldifontis]